MSIVRTMALAAVAVGLAAGAGTASAASSFNQPSLVKDIVSGDIFERTFSESDRELAALYIVGFSGAFNRQCGIFDDRVSGRFEAELRDHARAGKADLNDGRRVNHRTRAVLAGFEDGEKLAADYGCRGRVPEGAAHTIRRVFAAVR